jgi:TfoX N-terminal domain
MAYDQQTAKRMRKALSLEPNAVDKRLMGGLCFMVNGSMCCCVTGEGGLLIRVGPADYTRMLAEPHVEPMRMGRRTMTGFVPVAADGYRTDAALAKWIRRGLDTIAAWSKHPPRETDREIKKSSGEELRDSKINREWHERNRMQARAPLKQRVAWHRAHAQNCGCRPVPPNIASLIATAKNGDLQTKRTSGTGSPPLRQRRRID